MNRGFYIAATGMRTQRMRMEVINNNLANSDTIAFKTDDMITRSFGDLLLERLNERNVVRGAEVGPQGMGNHIDESVTDFREGSFEITEEKTDMAIAGEGFFVVRTPQGDRYTRAGNFTINPEGVLVTPEGYQLQSVDGQDIVVNTKDFTVDVEGNVFSGGELPVGTINVVTFEDLAAINKAGHNLFMGNNPIAAPNATVRQGVIEGSNVDVGRQVSDMMLTSRVFDACASVLSMIDSTMQRTVNDVAKF